MSAVAQTAVVVIDVVDGEIGYKDWSIVVVIVCSLFVNLLYYS